MSENLHSFLADEPAKNLIKFAEILKERGKLTVILDDAMIITTMAINGVPKPEVQAGDHHKVILFSDATWSWLVVIYQGFVDGNGLAALKIERAYLRREFCPVGIFNENRARRIVNGMLCILQVNPNDVEFDWSVLQGSQKRN